jgi:hypothetical protein
MTLQGFLRLESGCIAALMKGRTTVGLAALVLLLSAGDFFCAAKPEPTPARAAPQSGNFSAMTESQWNAVFRSVAKRIVSLHLRMILHQRIYETRTMAERMAKELGQKQPKLERLLNTAAGYRETTKLVRLKWDIPDGLVFAKKIQIGGYVDVGPGGKRRRGIPHAAIWVVGHQSVWKAWPGGGGWSVSIFKRSSSWWQQDLPLASQDWGLDDLRTIWLTPWQNMSSTAKYRLVKQSYDPSTNMINLQYLLLNPTHPSGTEKYEFRCELKLVGGLRIYRAVEEAVGGPNGRVRYQESDFRRFRKSNGVWFPTRARERMWIGDSNRIYYDDRLTVSRVAVNDVFPPHTFRYTPPFGAMVTDSRTRPASVYFVGSKNPGVPPATMPARGFRGSGRK